MKLDLHTHCYEASGYQPATPSSVERIVERVRAAGLDGIAVTDHHNPHYGRRVRDIVAEHFDNAILIIPGAEIVVGDDEVVELYVDEGRVFRFLAHPGYRYRGRFPSDISGLQGVEIDNDLHNWHIDKPLVRAFAEQHGLMLMRNSDAHDLSRIGMFYNEVDPADLLALAQPNPMARWLR